MFPGLEQYLNQHPNRLVYDTNQNPDFRPRMSGKRGVLQTLTTGVSSLWSTSKGRFIRHCLSLLIMILSLGKGVLKFDEKQTDKNLKLSNLVGGQTFETRHKVG